MFVRGKKSGSAITSEMDVSVAEKGHRGCLDNIGRTQGNGRKSLPGFQHAGFDPLQQDVGSGKTFCLASGPKEHPGKFWIIICITLNCNHSFIYFLSTKL